MLRKEGPEQKVDEMKRVHTPGLIFVFFPTFLSIVGVLILTQLLRLFEQYNYLRGTSSPIDQSVLALLGSDLTRIAVFSSGIIGMVLGLYLSRFVTTKLDVVRKEGETGITQRMYIALLFWAPLLLLPIQAIWTLDMLIYGPPTSKFLSDLGIFLMAGGFAAFAIPILSKYLILVMHARSIDSQVELVGYQIGSGFKRRFQNLTLRVIYDGPDP